jgi:hypothetical protein
MFPIDKTEHTRAESWNKVWVLNRLLKEGEYDVFWWIDDDMVLTNPDIDIRKVIDAHPSAPIIVQRDVDTTKHLFNCGMLIVRKCDESCAVFQKVWDEADERSIVHGNWEQDVMIRLYLDGTISQHVQLVDWKTLQSFLRVSHWTPEGLQWRQGDFVAHLSGEKTELRLELYKLLMSVKM